MKQIFKIVGLFSDYDGTLAPLNVDREESNIPTNLRRLLYEVSKKVPVGIITTKDMEFIRPRAAFATVIAAIGGLEIQVRRKRLVLDLPSEKVERIVQLYNAANELTKLNNKVFIEPKKINKKIVAFSIDCRKAEVDSIKGVMRRLIEDGKKAGLFVVKPKGATFVDIYPIEVNKGATLSFLRSQLHLKGPVLYLGDSEMDNPAFGTAEVSIGIRNKESKTKLTSRYIIDFEQVPDFISRLLKSNLCFYQGLLNL